MTFIKGLWDEIIAISLFSLLIFLSGIDYLYRKTMWFFPDKEALIEYLGKDKSKVKIKEVKRLVQRGVDINYQEGISGHTALTEVVRNNHFEVLKFLLAFENINLHLECYSGTALHIAIFFDNVEATQLLIDAGANVSKKSSWTMCDPIEYAKKLKSYKVEEFLQTKLLDEKISLIDENFSFSM